ncbi:MAG TPA: response regulator [Polyangia bacterium]|jgi:CheY-like chemotaxis protein|nr:response regulator [Polyangia bacterium]
MSHNGLSVPRPDETGPEAPAEAVPSSSRAVLVVEDDQAISTSLSEALREEGFAVTTAGNGRDALELLRAGQPPSAIILDLMMPVMDGWDFRHAQLHDPALKDIPVVVVTAAGFSAETIRMQFGNVVMIPKPVAYLDLLDALDRACPQKMIDSDKKTTYGSSP